MNFFIGHSRPLFSSYLQLAVNMFIIKFDDEWIRTPYLWRWKATTDLTTGRQPLSKICLKCIMADYPQETDEVIC